MPPLIVFDDADLDAAVEGAIISISISLLWRCGPVTSALNASRRLHCVR